MNKFQYVLLTTAIILTFTGCSGYDSQGNVVPGQVKKVEHLTPVFCGDYDIVDLSLGVMRNGNGSMSHEDLILYVPDPEMVTTFKEVSLRSGLVQVTYNTKRASLCHPRETVTSVLLLQDDGKLPALK